MPVMTVLPHNKMGLPSVSAGHICQLFDCQLFDCQLFDCQLFD
jgi:hypothetical protein